MSHVGNHQQLGTELLRKGDLEGAIVEYRMDLSLNPNDVCAHSTLGWALGKNGDLKEAIAEYRAALRLKPDSAENHFLARICLNENR